MMKHRMNILYSFHFAALILPFGCVAISPIPIPPYFRFPCARNALHNADVPELGGGEMPSSSPPLTIPLFSIRMRLCAQN